MGDVGDVHDLFLVLFDESLLVMFGGARDQIQVRQERKAHYLLDYLSDLRKNAFKNDSCWDKEIATNIYLLFLLFF